MLDITAYTGEHVKALFDSGCSFDDYILLSSSAVYPETNIQPFSEDQLTGRNSVWGDYGTNKIKAEEEALSRFEGAYILRPPYLYGRYNNIYRETFVFDCADMDREFFVPKSNMKLQFFHVDDLCRMMEIILDSRPKQHILNVGNERLLSVKEWVSLCYRAAEKAAKIVEVPSIIPQRNYFPFCDYEYRLDVTGQKKLLSETIPHEQGLSDAYRWYREHKDAVSARRPYLSFIDKNLH